MAKWDVTGSVHSVAMCAPGLVGSLFVLHVLLVASWYFIYMFLGSSGLSFRRENIISAAEASLLWTFGWWFTKDCTAASPSYRNWKYLYHSLNTPSGILMHADVWGHASRKLLAGLQGRQIGGRWSLDIIVFFAGCSYWLLIPKSVLLNMFPQSWMVSCQRWLLCGHSSGPVLSSTHIAARNSAVDI